MCVGCNVCYIDFLRFDGRMFSSERYFATVLLAKDMPSFLSRFTISESERGDSGDSLAIKVATFSLILVFDMLFPSAVWYPEVKKYFTGRTPHGVCTYLLAMARLTVVSWTPTTSATWFMVRGLRWLVP